MDPSKTPIVRLPAELLFIIVESYNLPSLLLTCKTFYGLLKDRAFLARCLLAQYGRGVVIHTLLARYPKMLTRDIAQALIEHGAELPRYLYQYCAQSKNWWDVPATAI